MEDFSEAADVDGELDGQLVVRPVSSSDNSISKSEYDQNSETEDKVIQISVWKGLVCFLVT
ncbi:hypothetical protein TorRG33x02_250250 [Trema orientale]|uniref:Uncharacterized protein n=1 Tax=Trema orientale TaxID=63057 RepID=A0A2P5DJ18_TREOI|nr:hypothetical protein TorRG33x02_250250 [Trema orientale]